MPFRTRADRPAEEISKETDRLPGHASSQLLAAEPS